MVEVINALFNGIVSVLYMLLQIIIWVFQMYITVIVIGLVASVIMFIYNKIFRRGK